MARLRKMFTAKTRREIGAVISRCKDFQVLCRWVDEQPSVLITGTDKVGHKLGCTVQLDPVWIHAATCSGQFVAAIIEELRAFLKPGSKFKQRRELINRIFVHAALLPLLDRES